MRIALGVVLLLVGFGLYLFDRLPHAMAGASNYRVYTNAITAIPVQDSYSAAEVENVMFSIWTNRVRLPKQASYSDSELRAAVFRGLGLGKSQSTVDRRTFCALVAESYNFEPHEPGIVAAAAPACLFAGCFVFGLGIGELVASRRQREKAQPSGPANAG